MQDGIDKIKGTPGDVADAATGGAVEAFAKSIRDGMEWVIKSTLSWWINTDSLSADNDSIITSIRDLVFPIAVIVAVAGVMVQGTRMAMSRKPDGLIHVAKGIGAVVLWISIGVVGPIALVQAGDEFSTWSLEKSTEGHFADKFNEALSMGSVTSAGAMIVLGVLAIIAGLVQALLMLLREGAILVLSGVLVLAAAGQFMEITSGWLRKVLAWLCALIFYKPAAALVYSAGFLILKDAKKDDPRTAFVGFAMLALSLVALPAMIKLFNWGIGGLESRNSGFGSGVTAGAAVVHATTSIGGAAGAAIGHAQYMTQTLGPSAASGSDGGAPQAMAPVGASSSPDAGAGGGLQVAQATAGGRGSEAPPPTSSPAAGAADTAGSPRPHSVPPPSKPHGAQS